MSQLKNRKLSAILFADIVGYSAMMQRDEQRAGLFLKKFREALSKYTMKFEGQIVQYYGDGCLCVFASSVHAVRCAADLQKMFLADPAVPVRIGLHSGDVFFEADNVYGDSVNIAARIESIGTAGAVLFSERVAKDLHNQPEFDVRFIGSAVVKNIVEPQKIFALTNPGLVVPSVMPSLKGSPGTVHSRRFQIQNFGWVAAVLIVLALGTYLIFEGIKERRLDQDGTVAVMDFDNGTGDQSFDIVGKMVTDRIVHGITQNELASVITSETLEEFGKTVIASPQGIDRIALMRNQFGVTEVINGHIYFDRDDIVFECTISNAKSKKVVKGLEPVRAQKSDPMVGVEKVRQLVLGFLASRKDRASDLLLETHVPKLEAYRALELAKATDDEQTELKYLNLAIELDSNYFEPKVLRLSWFYNDGSYGIMDSLRREIKSDPLQSDKRQQNLLNFYAALLDGQNDLVYHYMQREYSIAPFHLETNTTMIVLALQFIYQVKEALEIYREIPAGNLDYANCSNCRVRLYLKAYIDMELGRYEDALKASLLLDRYSSDAMSTEVLIKSYAGTKQWTDLDNLVSARAVGSQAKLYLDAAKASLQTGSDKQADIYAAKANEAIIADTDLFTASEIHLMRKDWSQATQLLEESLIKDSLLTEAIGYLAGLALKRGQTKVAEKYFLKLTQMRKPYQFGKIDYRFAQAYAIGDDFESALNYLEKSTAQGQRFNFDQYHYDFVFHRLRQEKAFEDILKSWH